jgi:hypothetical protein
MINRFHGDPQGTKGHTAGHQTADAAAAAAGTAANQATKKFFRIKHYGSPFVMIPVFTSEF